MADAFHVQQYTADLEVDVIRLWQDCGLTHPWNDPSKDISRKAALDDGLFLIGRAAGKIVATVMGGYDGHRGWLYYLGVHPDHRMHGYGRQMVEAIEAELLARGCPKVNLQVRHDSQEAVRFYQALGYGEDAVQSFGKRLITD